MMYILQVTGTGAAAVKNTGLHILAGKGTINAVTESLFDVNGTSDKKELELFNVVFKQPDTLSELAATSMMRLRARASG